MERERRRFRRGSGGGIRTSARGSNGGTTGGHLAWVERADGLDLEGLGGGINLEEWMVGQ